MDQLLVALEILLKKFKIKLVEVKANFKKFKWSAYSWNENLCHSIFKKIDEVKTILKNRQLKNKYKKRMLLASKRVSKYNHKIFSLTLDEFSTMITRDIINLAKQYTALERPLIQSGKIILNDDYFIQMRTYVITTLVTRYAAITPELDLLFYPNALETVIDLQYDLARIEALPNIVKLTMESFTNAIKLYE